MQEQSSDSTNVTGATNARPRLLSLEIPEQRRTCGRGKMAKVVSTITVPVPVAVGLGRGIRSWHDVNNTVTGSDPPVGMRSFSKSRTPSPMHSPAPCKVMEPMWSPKSLRSSSERVSPRSLGSDPDSCSECSFCSRPAGSIICRACGHTFYGRVRSRCPSHSCVVHLMDCEACPNCKAYQLKEFMNIRSASSPRSSSATT